jgi:hypothetical protein
MKTGTKIKIIKKGTAEAIETPVVAEEKHESNNDSKLASTVSNWINELQERHQQETKSAMTRFNS